MWKINSYAKINLGLNVHKLKTNETKHKLKSIFILDKHYFDEIHIEKSKTFSVSYYEDQKLVNIQNDIITKSVNFMKQEFANIDTNYYIKVFKHIPQKSGLGGSSTNGAAIINFLKQQNNLKFNNKFFKKVALELSSDIPFFISKNNIAIVSGYGQKVKKMNDKYIPTYKIIPNNLVSNTGEVYKKFDEINIGKIKKNKYKSILKRIYNHYNCIIINDLEKAAFILNPKLKEFKHKNTIMSGSGSFFIELEEIDESKN